MTAFSTTKALDLGQVQGTFGTFYGGDYPEDPYNIRAEYGRSDLDQRSRFVGSIVYQPRIFMGNFWTKQLLDNFMFSGTATEATGFPIQAVMSGYPQQIKGNAAIEGGLTGGVMSLKFRRSNCGKAAAATAGLCSWSRFAEHRPAGDTRFPHPRADSFPDLGRCLQRPQSRKHLW
jgi:hypothetical protein